MLIMWYHSASTALVYGTLGRPPGVSNLGVGVDFEALNEWVRGIPQHEGITRLYEEYSAIFP